MKTLKTYSTQGDMYVDLAALRSAGIAYYVANESLIQLDWFYANAVGWLQLQVSEEDYEDALKVLGAGESPQ